MLFKKLLSKPTLLFYFQRCTTKLPKLLFFCYTLVTFFGIASLGVMIGWFGKSYNIEHTSLLTLTLDFSMINKAKIDVANSTVKPDYFDEALQTNNDTPVTNLSMSEIKEIKAKTINPIVGTHNFITSAYKDHRLKDMIRVVAIVLRRKIGNLFCHLCDNKLDSCNVTKAVVKVRAKHRYYPEFSHTMAEILCDSSTSRSATKVRIANSTRMEKTLLHIPIRNIIKPPLSYNFTVCLSQIFNKYNDALQIVQTMEMYKILGIQRVAIYNISCGPDVEKVLKHYAHEGILEVIPWNIHDFMKPSEGWNPRGSPGDIHYHGQLVSLNECLNRYMFQSKYILFHDFDEIVLPYKHKNLNEMMSYLERLHNQTTIGEIKIKRYLFQEKDASFKADTNLHSKKWQSGMNILEYMSGISEWRPKVIVDPRQIVQIAVHETLQTYGKKILSIDLKPDIATIFHWKNSKVRRSKNMKIKKGDKKDTRLRDFSATLIQNVDKVLQQCGFS